jgi:hypothetical protein
MFNAPDGRYKQDVYLLPKKMGKHNYQQLVNGAKAKNLTRIKKIRIDKMALELRISRETVI